MDYDYIDEEDGEEIDPGYFDYLCDVYKEEFKEELYSLRIGIDKLFDNLKDEQFSNQPFFHYTTLDTLKIIASSSTLRFTNIKYLNDPSEGDEINSIIPQVCDELSASDPPNAGVYAIIKNVFSTNGSCIREQKLKQSFEKIMGGDHFVSCFSTVSDYLPLWTYYSLKSGCCIEYSPKDFSNTKYQVRLEPIIYDDETKKRIVRDIIKMIADMRYVKDNADEVRRIVVYVIDRLKPMFKSQDFSFEKEVRAIICDVDKKDINYRTKEGYIIPYCDMSITKTEYQVTMGPLYKPELDSLNNYLKQHNGIAKRSKIKLRF